MGKKMIDITGQKFGRLYVIERDKIKKGRRTGAFWKCRCDCGNIVTVYGYDIRQGSVRSCGCLHHDQLVNRLRSHGMTGTRLYRIWQAMIKRCNSPNYERYKDYGGRGITVCEEWHHDFQSFYDWAMSHGYKDDLTIDRIDVNGNYCPENCRWATYKVQGGNTRRIHHMTYKGETHSMIEWSKIKGIKYSTLAARINIYHWDIEKALTTPVK